VVVRVHAVGGDEAGGEDAARERGQLAEAAQADEERDDEQEPEGEADRALDAEAGAEDAEEAATRYGSPDP
jgi:hypothetical protein